MTLHNLLSGLDYECLQGSTDCPIRQIHSDSRALKAGDLFICISGFKQDGHDFIAAAMKAGVRAIVLETETTYHAAVGAPICRPPSPAENVSIIKVADSRHAMALIAANFYRHPARELKTIAITGTKGKTTTAYMIHAILTAAGYKVGLIGTIEVIIGARRIPAQNTTPESVLLQRYLREMADAGLDMVVMETASQGFKLHRTAGILFDIGIFTNLSPDHIGHGEHADFNEYLECKRMLFRQCRTGFVNKDDAYYEQIIAGHGCEMFTYGMGPSADLYALDMELYRGGGDLGVRFRLGGLMNFSLSVAMPGRYSVKNSLAALLCCHHFGVSEEIICRALMHIKVKGRVEMLNVSDDYTLLIDYAHNAMSLNSLLMSLREYGPERLVCLFGCGGNRDRARRHEMGLVGARRADLSIITSDNPRDEDPAAIIADIRAGSIAGGGAFVEIADRRAAIAYVLDTARPGDIIVLAGKGHEDYQEIKGKKYPMDEREIVEAWKKSTPTSS